MTTDDRGKLALLAAKTLARTLEEVRPGRPEESWTGLVKSWETLAADANEYRDSIYDYTNELSVRDVLDTVIHRLDDDLRARVEPDILRVDCSFIAATREVDMPLPGAPPDRPRWWWWRIPIDAGDELAADLKSERVIDG